MQAITDQVWADKVATIVKTELKKRGLNYIDLQNKLQAAGIAVTANNIRVKMKRGTFSSIFLIQCLWVIGVKNLNLEDYLSVVND